MGLSLCLEVFGVILEVGDEENAVADEAKARNDSATKRIFVEMAAG